MNLTTTIARNLEPPSGKADHIEWDDDFPGFGVRLRVGRNRVSRNWVYQYDFAGRTRRITLGNVNAVSIQDARRTAGQLHGKVRLGQDPMMEKAESLARAADTFASVMDSHLKMAKVRIRADGIPRNIISRRSASRYIRGRLPPSRGVRLPPCSLRSPPATSSCYTMRCAAIF
jgi:hypothetical protein